MPGGRDPVGGGVRATDNGGETHIMGSTEGTGPVQGGYGDRIFGGAQNDTEWASGTGETDLKNLGHGGRAVAILHGLPG